MKSKEEMEYERRKKQTERFMKLYENLPPLVKFEFYLRIHWLYYIAKIKHIPLNWIQSQIKLDEDLERFGMPYRLRRLLQHWFNYPLYNNDNFFLIDQKKIWYSCFLEEDNFELHLYYRNRYPGHIWFEVKENRTAEIIGIGIQENFRNKGLGTIAFQESIQQISDRVSCIKGVLEKEYYPEPEDSLRWLRRQGFQIEQQLNGDHKCILWL